jgi:hypothetical protein
MSRVTIFGPSIRFEHEWHVHASDCQDCRKYHCGEEGWMVDVETKRDVVENVYCDILEENDATWDEYVIDFKFFPCCDLD